MPIITLTTDFGTKDHSSGALKGAIYTEIPEAIIVDITHQITPFHLEEAAYIIKNAYHNFPKGTIHIIGIDSEETPENKQVAFLFNDHYFICADNGIISLIISEFSLDSIVAINLPNIENQNFPELSIFVRVACHLARGGTLDVIGKRIESYKQLKTTIPIIQENKLLIGSVIYIDNYGNVITNITKRLFTEIQKGRKFKITAKRITFTTIVSHYSEAINFTMEKSKREEDGKKIALFNASGHLELAIYKSNPKTVGAASTLFGLQFRDTVSITFEN